MRRREFIAGLGSAVAAAHRQSRCFPELSSGTDRWLAAQTRLATICPARGAVALGGLMSCGVPTSLTNDVYRLAGPYAGQILDGAVPAESPVMLPTRFEFVINDRTAKALRIAIPRRCSAVPTKIID